MDLKHYADLGEEYVAACLGEEELSHGFFPKPVKPNEVTLSQAEKDIAWERANRSTSKPYGKPQGTLTVVTGTRDRQWKYLGRTIHGPRDYAVLMATRYDDELYKMKVKKAQDLTAQRNS